MNACANVRQETSLWFWLKPSLTRSWLMKKPSGNVGPESEAEDVDPILAVTAFPSCCRYPILKIPAARSTPGHRDGIDSHPWLAATR